MLDKYNTKLTALLRISLFLTLSFQIYAQDSIQNSQKNNFWNNVNFGGNFGLGVGNNLTNILVGPSAVYNFNEYFAAGVGLHYAYLNQKNVLKSNMYGGSLLVLANPVSFIQLSAELEQLRVNQDWVVYNEKRDFWNTALFLGAGYRQQNVTFGVRYNVLFNKKENVYNEAFMPFLRVYF